jgi:hypothetical protein
MEDGWEQAASTGLLFRALRAAVPVKNQGTDKADALQNRTGVTHP